MELVERLCPGCNEKFAPDSLHVACPRCGQTLTSQTQAVTLDFTEMHARNVPVDHVRAETSDDPMMGRSLGIYDVEAFLGRGGMAQVYRAIHRMLHRPCALKVLNPQLVLHSPDYVHLFLSEARVAASLVHPHVVTIHTIGYDEGLHFLEMEYVVGRSLSEVIQAQPQMEVALATRFMVEISSALSEAHNMHLIHRDIKPGNVLVTAQGVAKLADFGLAKRVMSDENASGRQISGTPYFMAPELFAGTPAGCQTDVYAMGVTFFNLLTNKMPYAGKSVQELAAAHTQAPVPDIRRVRDDVPEEIAAIVQRCLHKSPRERYGHAAELHQELRAAYGCVRDLGALLAEAMEGTPAQCICCDGQYQVHVDLPGGRSQTVQVEACASTAVGTKVVRISSPCGPARPSFYQRALELNATLPHAAIAIEHRADGDLFVMSNSYPRATCDPEEIRETVLLIARHADAIELALTGADRH